MKPFRSYFFFSSSVAVPRTVEELVAHYTKNELPRKSPYAQEVYGGYLNIWIVPKWGNYSLSDVPTVQVEAWLGTLKQLANGTRAKLRNIMSAILHMQCAGNSSTETR